MAVNESEIALVVKAEVDKAIGQLRKANAELDKINATSASDVPAKAFQRQLGIIEKLNKSIKNLQVRRERANSPEKISKYNNLLDKQKTKLNALVASNNKVADSNKRNADILGKIKGLAGGLITAYALKRAAEFSTEISIMGDELKQVQGPFDKLVKQAGLSAPEALEQLQGAVKKTTSNLALMQRAGQAMDAFTASGLTANAAWSATTTTLDFLFKYATKFGKSLPDLMRTVFTGLQRGSALFLDDVGIMIDQTDKMFAGLNPVEKKAKLVSVALEQMATKTALLGEVQDGARLQQAQLSAEWDNFLAILGADIEPTLANIFRDLNETLTDFTQIPFSEKLTEELVSFNALAGAVQQTNEKSEQRVRLIKKLKDKYGEYLPDLNTEKTTNEELAKMMVKVNTQLKEKIKLLAAQEVYQEDLRETVELQREQDEALEDFSKRYTEVTGKNIEDGLDFNKVLREFRDEAASAVGGTNTYLKGIIKVRAGVGGAANALQNYLDITDDLTIAQESLAKKLERVNELTLASGDGGKKKTKTDGKEQKELQEANRKAAADGYKALQELDDFNKEYYANNADAIIDKADQQAKTRETIGQKNLDFITALREKDLLDAIAVADAQLEHFIGTEEQRKELIALRAEYVQEAADLDLEINKEYAAALSQILAAPFADMTQDLLDGSANGQKIFKSFLDGIRKQMAKFLADQLFTIFSNFLFNLVSGGSASVLSGTLFGTAGSKAALAADGAHVSPSQNGTPYIVGENNTEEVIVPVKKFAAFVKGNYSLPGGYNISNIPGMQKLAPQTMQLPVFNAPAGPGIVGGIATSDAANGGGSRNGLGVTGQSVNMQPVVAAIQNLQGDVQVLQQERLFMVGEDIFRGVERVRQRVI